MGCILAHADLQTPQKVSPTYVGDAATRQKHKSQTVHNVLFGQYVFLPTEQAETYFKIYVLIYH